MAAGGFVRLRQGGECKSADAHFDGDYDSVEACERACALTPGCRFFLYGTGHKAGQCWQEFTENEVCAEGWEDDDYDFYSLVRYSLVGSVRLHVAGECQSPDMPLGNFDAVHECASACARMSGCSFFIFGMGSKAGSCWHELSTSAECPEGFESDEYDFYQLKLTPSRRTAPPPPPRLPSSAPMICAPCEHWSGVFPFVAGVGIAALAARMIGCVMSRNNDGRRTMAGARHAPVSMTEPDLL